MKKIKALGTEVIRCPRLPGVLWGLSWNVSCSFCVALMFYSSLPVSAAPSEGRLLGRGPIRWTMLANPESCALGSISLPVHFLQGT